MEGIPQNSELHPPTLTTFSPSNAAPKPKPLGPIPMSMPSILRNPGVPASSNHLSSHLKRSSSTSSRLRPRSGSSKELGRRKQRRSENARLLSNPHAVRPTLKDYRLHSNPISPTFTSLPIASGKQHSVPVPAHSGVKASEPTHDSVSAKAGHFGSSLKQAQQLLKRLEIGNINDSMIQQGRAGELERFIWLVDKEIRQWADSEVHLYPSSSSDRKVGKVLLDKEFNFTTTTVELDTIRPGEGGQLIEFQRTPNALVWLVHDPFLRLIVHCLARVSRCPSFSKDDSRREGCRFTWILNRNPMARRSRRGRRVSVSSSAISTPLPAARNRGEMEARGIVGGLGGMETPPTTDFNSETESEFAETSSETDSLADSLTLQPPASGVGDREGEGETDEDEAEAEILRRVRRWAIDSHRQRHSEVLEGAQTSASRKSQLGNKPNEEEMDPDSTLIVNTIAEEEDEDQVESYASA